MEDFGQELLYTSEYNANLSKECNLGLNYYYGTNGYEKDHLSAYSIFKELGEAGDKDACVQLGCMYFLGHAVEKDYNSALKWWGKAEDHDEALYGMGMIYHTGSEIDGIIADPEKAVHYWERASDMFNEAATAALYKYYKNQPQQQTVNNNVTHVHTTNDKETKEHVNQLKFELEMAANRMDKLEKAHTTKIQNVTIQVKKLETNITNLTALVQVLSKELSKTKSTAVNTNEIMQKVLLKIDDIQVAPVVAEKSGSQLDLNTKISYVDTDADRVKLPHLKKQRERKKARLQHRRSQGKMKAKKNLKAYMQMMLKVRKRQNKRGSKKSEREELIDVFKTFDRDGDGTITADEFRKGMMTLGHHLTTKQVKDLISEVDEDGNAEIDYEEFVEMMLMQDTHSMEVEESQHEASDDKLPVIHDDKK
mmetsp:Transcript_4757/g.7040  ORF Transcript_4757/g.7040 Transcript_4757/m.7040 type:complete len:422 (-) Transcript_4757:62-1327(-)